MGKARVSCEENNVERFRKRDVHGVVGRDVVDELRRSTQKWERGVAGERQHGEVIDGVTKSSSGEVAGEVQATEHRQGLNVGKIGNGGFPGGGKGRAGSVAIGPVVTDDRRQY